MNLSVESLPALDLDVAGPSGPRIRPTLVDPGTSLFLVILIPLPI
ncbi:hypothetical protein S2M10_26030 [Sphingomonas sp. S2M10]|jgi:hypothetical protein|nr:hypothetical protein [Sphingomonas sp. S2M10]NLS27604.1 hypothetical protein [Sphingomonas sp. S2M10]